ncbi:MAG: hypothetical protein ACPG8W_10380 [Candidatus Promineifilaceae bacterium]
MSGKRPPIRIKFRFDTETGMIDLVVDDSAPDQTEAYHDRVAMAVAQLLARNPQISDAGARHLLDQVDQLAQRTTNAATADDRETLMGSG